MKFLKLLGPLICTLMMLTGCTKNEFTVQVKPAENRAPMDMQLEYYASDAKSGWLVTCDLPGSVSAVQQAVCPTRYPSVGFLYSGGNLLTVFYAERGDKIVISYRDGLWLASGNAVTDSLSLWQIRNRNIIAANAATELNKCVETYVTKHPANTLSAILLYVYFRGNKNPDLYERLQKMLKDDAADKRLARALGVLPSSGIPSTTALRPLRLRTTGDSTLTVNPADARATVFLFWNNETQRRQQADTIVKKLKKITDIQLVEVNMQADTLSWRQAMATDSTSNIKHLWAPGAEQNEQLLPYSLPAPDYLIVANRKGKIIYRGTDADKAAAKALTQQ